MQEATTSSRFSKYFLYFCAFLGGVVVLAVVYLIVMHAIYEKKGGVLRDFSLSDFSGCGKGIWLITATDAEFSEEWKKSSKAYEFVAEDIDKKIRKCEEGISNYGGIVSRFDSNGKPLLYEDSALVKRIQEYHQKFLNREFSALKESDV